MPLLPKRKTRPPKVRKPDYPLPDRPPKKKRDGRSIAAKKIAMKNLAGHDRKTLKQINQILSKMRVGKGNPAGKDLSTMGKIRESIKKTTPLRGALKGIGAAGVGGSQRFPLREAVKKARLRKPTGRLNKDDIKGVPNKRGGGIVKRGMGRAK